MKTSFAYPKYKYSGIDWLGKIPEHWEVRKLKHIASVKFSSVDKHTKEGEETVLLCNYVDVYYNEFITHKLELMSASATPSEIDKFELEAGDVIITKDSEGWDDIAIPAYVPHSMKGVLCGYHLAPISPLPNYLNGKFLFRAFSATAVNDQFKIASNGITRYGLGKYSLDNGLFPVPPIDEQQAIAAFLDRETGRVDELIKKKERQVELLKEKSSALISHAVTKGLDPNAKMKPSGIEWLGAIPEHWKVRKLKHVAQAQFSSVDKHTAEGEELVKLCNYTDVYYNDFIENELDFMIASAKSAEIDKFILKAGDVIITKDSEGWDDIAIPAYVPRELGMVLCGYHLAQIRSIPNRLHGKYLFRAFSATGINDQFKVAANGITRYGLGKYALDNGLFPIPPFEEQRVIADFLDQETSHIDKLIEKVNKSIEMLREYRTALISAAVTGKIDVRKEVE